VAIQGLKIYDITKGLYSDTEEVLGSVSGCNLCGWGPFIYVTGNGSSAGYGSKNISKLIPPADKSDASTGFNAYGSGIIDSQQTGLSACSLRPATSSVTTTGSGTFNTYSLGNFTDSHPFTVALLGDRTAHGYYGVKANGVTKSNLVPAPDDATSTFRVASRQKVTLASDVTGSIYVSSWGNTVVLNASSVAFNTTSNGNKVLGTIPSGYRPSTNITINLSQNNGSRFYKAYVTSAGEIIIYSSATSTSVSNCWGCGIWCTSTGDNSSGLYSTVSLKVNGTTKTVLQYTGSNYNAMHTTATNASGITGTCHVWKVGGFVYGNAYGINTGITSTMANRHGFTLPVGYRPVATSYSTGYMYLNKSGSYSMVRAYARIDTNGEIRFWGNGSSDNTDCGLVFYHYAGI
jgi:hypothetical protein